jgi:Spy/CpxP family protein refolding chaperone
VFHKIAAVLFISTILVVPAYSQEPPSSSSTPMRPHDTGMMPMRGMASDEQIDRAVDTLKSTLNLSPAQVTSIRQLARDRRESYRAIHSQARPKFEQLKSLLAQPNPDPAAVGKIVIDLNAIHEQARAKQKDVEKQLSGILNPSQQQTVDNLRKQAGTFMALRSLGLLGGPEFRHGMMSMMGQSTDEH